MFFKYKAITFIIFAITFNSIYKNPKLILISCITYITDKDKIISQVYNDPLGFGSNHSTLKDARKLDPSITLEDIQKWKQDNIERKNTTQRLQFICCK